MYNFVSVLHVEHYHVEPYMMCGTVPFDPYITCGTVPYGNVGTVILHRISVRLGTVNAMGD